MKTFISIIVVFFLLTGCATGGKVAGNGTATGGSVEVGDVVVSPEIDTK